MRLVHTRDVLHAIDGLLEFEWPLDSARLAYKPPEVRLHGHRTLATVPGGPRREPAGPTA